MAPPRRLVAAIRAVVRRRPTESELDEELQAFLAASVDAKIRAGMRRDEALRAARLELGGIAAVKDRVRDVGWQSRVDDAWRDLRHAVRSLAASPSFTFAAILTIILTVGGLSTIFALVNGVLLTPLPYPDSDRFVRLAESDRGRPSGLRSLASADIADIRRDSRTIEAVAAYRAVTYVIDLDASPRQLRIWTASPDLFPMLGTPPLKGRWLASQDERAGGEPAGVLDYDVWQTMFGGRGDIVGQRVHLARPRFDGVQDFTIVGVMPPDFAPPVGDGGLEAPSMWVALRDDMLDRGDASYHAVAKLRRGASLGAARAELSAIAGSLATAYPDTNRDRRISASFLLNEIVGGTQQILWIFFGAVWCVLLIGVANLVSLQIVRNSARERELVVRAALGAGRGRLVRQLTIEALVLSVAGGLAALLLARLGVRAVLAALPPRFPRADQIRLSPEVVVSTLLVAIAVGLVVGMVPAWKASRPDLQGTLGEATRSATLSARRSGTQRWLIVVETALAAVLVAGAALLTHSLWRLVTTESGMNEAGLSSVGISLPLRYRTEALAAGFWQAALERVGTLPQVESAAALVNAMGPLTAGDIMRGGLLPEASTGDPRRDGATMSHRPVSGGYFATLGIPILRGRPILDSDDAGSPLVAVLNESGARLLWPDGDALGKRIRDGDELLTVVGIVPDFKLQSLSVAPRGQLFRSYRQLQGSYTGGAIVVRTTPGAAGTFEAIRVALTALEPQARVDIQTAADLRWTQVAPERFRAGVLLIFAAAAVFLAVVGIFGLVSYSVVQRRREIGVRMALGAMRGDIARLMLRQALIPSLAGLVVGLIAAAGSSRLVGSLLYEVGPTDPLTFAAAAVCLLLAALTASLVPAWKATRVDPSIALRCE